MSVPFQIPIWRNGSVSSSELLYKRHFRSDIDFATADWLAGSSEVAFTNEYILSVKKNDVEIGTITWAAAATVPTFDMIASPTSFVDTDTLTIVAPVAVDPTGSGIALTMLGTRV